MTRAALLAVGMLSTYGIAGCASLIPDWFAGSTSTALKNMQLEILPAMEVARTAKYENDTGAWGELRAIAESENEVPPVSPRHLVMRGSTKAVSGAPAFVTATAYSPDGSRLATAHQDGPSLRIWDTDSGVALRAFTEMGGPIVSLLWLDNVSIAAVDTVGYLTVWNTKGEATTALSAVSLVSVTGATIVDPFRVAATSMALSGDRNWLAVGGAFGAVAVFDLRNGLSNSPDWTIGGFEDWVTAVDVFTLNNEPVVVVGRQTGAISAFRLRPRDSKLTALDIGGGALRTPGADARDSVEIVVFNPALYEYRLK
jgi:hypothetical protein